jgi:phytoene dehydrogenase-like protein
MLLWPFVGSPNHIPSKIDTIVIGSGIGASTCASSLAQSGQRVLVLEKHFRTGGCTHSFRSQDKTVEFDTGLVSSMVNVTPFNGYFSLYVVMTALRTKRHER